MCSCCAVGLGIQPCLRKKYLEDFAEKCKQLWGWAGKEAVVFTELWKREDEAAEEASELEEETISENNEAEEGGAEDAADDQNDEDN